MNILPKKRWHVRTKENIARVRRDEAEAAAKEKEEQKRIENANREARLGILKQRAKQKLNEIGGPSEPSPSAAATPAEHINFFSDIERSLVATNKDHELEAKNKKEEYEKQIGYLTYLGQDTNEALGKKNWYELPPDAARFSRPDSARETYTKLVLRDEEGKPKPTVSTSKNGEVSWKSKQAVDPIQSFKHLCFKVSKKSDVSSDKIKHKETDKSKTEKHRKRYKTEKKQEKEEKLKKLREARVKRELEERRKARALLAAVSGFPVEPTVQAQPQVPKIKPKYNSQFNPELARQNYTYR